jgi:hypothetical protein
MSEITNLDYCCVCGAYVPCFDGVCEECFNDFENDYSMVVIPFEIDGDPDYVCRHRWRDVVIGGEECSECTICHVVDC